MDTMSAFAQREANRGKPLMVFDWEKAARLITERRPCIAMAGLQDDWGYTGGQIWRDNQPVLDSYTYLASTWAAPEIDLDGEIEPCWRWQDDAPGWDHATKWPAEANAILHGPLVGD